MSAAWLDTNIVPDLFRNPQGRVTDRIREVGEAQVATSIIVAAELRYGAVKKAYPCLTAQVEAVLGGRGLLQPARRVASRFRSTREPRCSSSR